VHRSTEDGNGRPTAHAAHTDMGQYAYLVSLLDKDIDFKVWCFIEICVLIEISITV